jgi:hypothetical protein
MNPELETLKAIERQLKDTMEDSKTISPHHLLTRLKMIEGSIETALTIIKDRKATIEEKEFNDPDYYNKNKHGMA